MPSFIPQISQFLESNFDLGWLDSYLDYDDSISDSNKGNVSTKVGDLLDVTIDFFFKSLISGEYILDTKKIINDIESLKREANTLLTILVENSDTQEFLLTSLKENYIDILKIFSNIYLNFIKLVQSQNENPNIDIVYEASFDTLRFFNQVSSDNIRAKIKFFDLIVFVYRIDHFFNEDVTTYSAINQLENSIKEHISSVYFVLIKEKLNFLKFKWEIRQKSYKKRNYKLSKAYIIDDEMFKSGDNVSYNPTLDKLKIWKEYIQCYYELDSWSSKLNNITNEFKHKRYSNLSTLELIFLLKNFKDVNKDYSNLKDVVDEFEKRYESNSSSEQRFLYNKTYLYALNNLFSSLLEQETVNDSSVLELKNKIEKIQNKCNIDNFFIDSKHINFKLNQLSQYFDNREELADLSNHKEELDKLTNSIRIYKQKLFWSQNNHNLLFQLPYKECLIKSNITDLDVFYASSIVLPLPHEESQNNYEKVNTKLKELKQLVLSVVSLNKEFSTIKNLKEEIKSNQIKTLETIGVFTAITAFILASIPSFSFVKEFYQAFLFTMIIGISLFLMVSLIFLFTRGFRKIKSWVVIGISLILFLITIFTLRESVRKLENNIKTKYNHKIDSVFEINKSKIDSITKLNLYNLEVKKIEIDSIIKSHPYKNNPTSKK